MAAGRLVLIGAEDQPTRLTRWTEDLRAFVVVDDLELVDLIHVAQALEQFGFDPRQGVMARGVHASGTIEDIDELVALGVDAEH